VSFPLIRLYLTRRQATCVCGASVLFGTSSGQIHESWERQNKFLSIVFKYILHEIRKRKQTGLVTFCVETALYNGLLKERYKAG
jgi:hypothetical protein